MRCPCMAQAEGPYVSRQRHYPHLQSWMCMMQVSRSSTTGKCYSRQRELALQDSRNKALCARQAGRHTHQNQRIHQGITLQGAMKPALRFQSSAPAKCQICKRRAPQEHAREMWPDAYRILLPGHNATSDCMVGMHMKTLACIDPRQCCRVKQGCKEAHRSSWQTGPRQQAGLGS